jgi:hypothetical protein
MFVYDLCIIPYAHLLRSCTKTRYLHDFSNNVVLYLHITFIDHIVLVFTVIIDLIPEKNGKLHVP